MFLRNQRIVASQPLIFLKRAFILSIMIASAATSTTSSSNANSAAVGRTVAKSNGSGQVMGLWWTSKKVLNDGSRVVLPPSEGSETVPTDAASKFNLVKKIRYSMLTLKGDFMDPKGTSVRYDLMKESPKFLEYVDLVRELKFINMGEMSVEERKAFLINIYNSLVIHALVEGLLPKFPGGSLSRIQLYASASYNIGGQVYSLNDIENGLLRGNRLSAVPYTRAPFAVTDAEKINLMLKCDPRIHFALNCGAVSCPPIAVYEAESLEDQLDTATSGFLEGNTVIDSANNTISLSMLFEWYKEDFGTESDNIINWIKENSPQELKESLIQLTKPTLKFSTYNWDLNDK